jgi:hypothetical protein
MLMTYLAIHPLRVRAFLRFVGRLPALRATLGRAISLAVQSFQRE